MNVIGNPANRQRDRIKSLNNSSHIRVKAIAPIV